MLAPKRKGIFQQSYIVRCGSIDTWLQAKMAPPLAISGTFTMIFLHVRYVLSMRIGKDASPKYNAASYPTGTDYSTSDNPNLQQFSYDIQRLDN